MGRTRGRADYSDLQAFCLFVGYGRSGHSLVGSLLDAHPDINIAHEANAASLALKGMSRADLFETLLQNSSRQADRGRMQSGFSYAVRGQWQGRIRALKVLGDKAGGKTARLVARNPDALEILERTVAVPLRLIHVTRNPFDSVARLALVSTGPDRIPKRTLAEAIEVYRELAHSTHEVTSSRRWPLITVRYESLIEAPERELKRLCHFLGVDAEGSYVHDCCAIVFPSARRTRRRVEWSREERDAVTQIIAHHDSLRDYGWDT